jgi:hypothetical protein
LLTGFYSLKTLYNRYREGYVTVSAALIGYHGPVAFPMLYGGRDGHYVVGVDYWGEERPDYFNSVPVGFEPKAYEKTVAYMAPNLILFFYESFKGMH